MNTKKNIDKLFQEQFNNHEVLPPDIVWDTIAEKLKEKRKRRVIPFWLRYTGVAALLAIGLGLYNNQFNDTINTPSSNSIVNGSENSIKQKNNLENNEVSNPYELDHSQEKNTKSNSSEKGLKNDLQINSSDKKKYIIESPNISNVSNNSIATSEDSKHAKDKNQKASYKQKTDKEYIVNSNMTSDNNVIAKNKTDVITDLAGKKLESNKQIISTDKESIIEKSEDAIADYNTNNGGKTSNSIAEHNKLTTKNTVIDKTINDLNKMDSTKVALVEPNALEELLKEKEKEITKKEPKLNRWQLTPNVAPIYFSSTSNGSPLDAQLSNNTKDYATNYSYGLGVNYALSKKMKLRSGVNIFSVGYATNGIAFEQTAKASRMENITPNAQGALIQIKPVGAVATTVYSRSAAAQNQTIVVNTNMFDGSLNQQLGYFELPLELSYKIIDKKIGLEFIGGMSTLLLNQNEVSLVSDALNMKIGEANNLNSIHFSGNIGLGLKYNFWKKLDARVEPVFKYQFNTFTNDVGNFRPYIFGVYSGLSYTF
jgi:hypothetical protein